MSAALTHEPRAELVRVDESYEGMTMAVSPAEAKRRVQELQAFVQSVMVRNEDFGTIPGTEKPSLYQPGAQKLAEIYGLAHSFVAVEQVKDWERGFFYFEYRCLVTSRRDGRHICEGIGSCNSRESKYGARWVFDRDVPPGMNRATLKTKEITSKKNGQRYTMYQVPNEDIYSLVNTLQKMAAKRAYVHAIISATRSAGVFTQDAEDLPAEVFGKPEAERSWEHDPDTGEVQEKKPTLPPPTPPAQTSGPGRSAADAAIEAARINASNRYEMRRQEIMQAPDLATLKSAWAKTVADAKATKITLDHRAHLAALKDARKIALEEQEATGRAAEDARANDLGDDPAGLGPGKGRTVDTPSGTTTYGPGWGEADAPPPEDDLGGRL